MVTFDIFQSMYRLQMANIPYLQNKLYIIKHQVSNMYVKSIIIITTAITCVH